jgi:hypothetical protein
MPHDARVARIGRIVAAGFPHHVTQRGNRRQTKRPRWNHTAAFTGVKCRQSRLPRDLKHRDDPGAHGLEQLSLERPLKACHECVT